MERSSVGIPGDCLRELTAIGVVPLTPSKTLGCEKDVSIRLKPVSSAQHVFQSTRKDNSAEVLLPQPSDGGLSLVLPRIDAFMQHGRGTTLCVVQRAHPSVRRLTRIHKSSSVLLPTVPCHFRKKTCTMPNGCKMNNFRGRQISPTAVVFRHHHRLRLLSCRHPL